LREAEYSVVIQASDFGPGANFVLEMDRATREAERTIAVLSPDYLTALFTHPEWAATFAKDGPRASNARSKAYRRRSSILTWWDTRMP
jgi:hypothetical protein